MEADADQRCAVLLEVDAGNQERRFRLRKKRGLLTEAAKSLERLTTEVVQEGVGMEIETEVKMQMDDDGDDLYI